MVVSYIFRPNDMMFNALVLLEKFETLDSFQAM